MFFGALVVPFTFYLRGDEPGPLLFANLFAFGLCLLALARNSARGWFGWLAFPAVVVAVFGELTLPAALTLVPVLTSWAYTARVWSRPWARWVGVGHIVLYILTVHPFLVAHGPTEYAQLVTTTLNLDPSGLMVQLLGDVVPTVWSAGLVVAVLLPGFLLLDLAVWSLRAERDRRRG